MREQIAVYGSGTIGSCEATLIIGHGVPCTVIGHSERGLDRCRNAVAQNWDDLIAEGLATEANKQAALALLTVTNDPAALKDHTFVFEAVTEGAAEKQSAYAAIAQYAAQDAIIASCSSSMDAEILAALTPCPERLLIAHPFQPVHMLPLVEVVRHRRTQEEVVSRTLTLLEQLHRQVVVLAARSIYTAPADRTRRLPMLERSERPILCAAPILAHGDIEGGVLLPGTGRDALPEEEAVHAVATAAAFLAKWMEE